MIHRRSYSCVGGTCGADARGRRGGLLLVLLLLLLMLLLLLGHKSLLLLLLLEGLEVGEIARLRLRGEAREGAARAEEGSGESSTALLVGLV